MLTHVACTNFRGFRKLDVDLAGITAFLGPNSSGKTTALHAVRLGCHALRLALEADAPARVKSEKDGWVIVGADVLVDASDLLPVADWRALFVDQAVGEGVSFSIALTFDAASPITEVAVWVACAHNERLKLSVHAKSPLAVAEVAGLGKKSSQVNQRITDFLRRHAPLAVFVPPFYGAVTGEELRARVVIDRLLGSGDQSHVVRNLVSGLEPELLDRLNAFLQEATGATVTYRTSGDALQTESPMRVRFRDNNGELELSAAGAGLVNLIALYSALSRWRRDATERAVLFLLDEPEAHLHPRLQADSTAFLGKVVTQEFGAQLLLATHSVDILNRLATDGHLLLRCDRSATPSIVALDGHSALFDELAAWVDLTPYTAINFLASRRVLFVEGKDDFEVLPALAAARYRSDPTKLRLFRWWGLVKLEGTGNQAIAELLARLVRSDAVRASAKAGGFQCVVVLDRDHERTPGTETKTEDGVTQTKVVWSAHSLESLLVRPPVLAQWLAAYLGPATPPDLDARIAAAVAATDGDAELNREARSALTTALVGAAQRAGVALMANGGQAVKEASEEADRRVTTDPAIWQRGKDRARAILGRIREGLPPETKAQFPTDVCRIVRTADRNRLGDIVAATPPEVQALFDRMTQP